METIEVGAFYHCFSLKNITILSSIASISDSSFQSCSALEAVIIGEGAETIEGFAFSLCSSLKCIYFYGKKSPTFVTTKCYNKTDPFMQWNTFIESNTFTKSNTFSQTNLLMLMQIISICDSLSFYVSFSGSASTYIQTELIYFSCCALVLPQLHQLCYYFIPILCYVLSLALCL